MRFFGGSVVISSGRGSEYRPCKVEDAFLRAIQKQRQARHCDYLEPFRLGLGPEDVPSSPGIYITFRMLTGALMQGPSKKTPIRPSFGGAYVVTYTYR